LPHYQVQPPWLIGENIDDAEIILQDTGFSNIVVNEVLSQEIIGTVINQSPEPAQWVNYESEIYLEVSNGVEVPNVIGLKENKAINTLEGQGFIVDIQYGNSTEPVDQSVVYTQEPDPLTYVEYNSTVVIYIQE